MAESFLVVEIIQDELKFQVGRFICILIFTFSVANTSYKQFAQSIYFSSLVQSSWVDECMQPKFCYLQCQNTD